MTYNFTLIYPNNRKKATVRQVLNDLLIPRKWQHELRVKKQIAVNHHYRNFNEFILPGDEISFKLDFISSHQQTYPASGKKPETIYEDENVLVINKAKGQKTHPNQAENNTALNDCATYLGYSPYIVHRLDMLTGGLLLVAKNPAVVPILNRQLTNKTFHREYLATVCHPEFLKESGTINQAIGHDPNDPRKRMISPTGLNSVTHYQVIKQNKDQAELKIKLETGRTHQIRVHLAAIGCPIIGDPLYNPDFKKEQELQLTAYQMSFIEPFSFSRKQIKLTNFDPN